MGTIGQANVISNSGLQHSVLIEVGSDQRLADPEPLEAMLAAVEQSAYGTQRRRGRHSEKANTS